MGIDTNATGTSASIAPVVQPIKLGSLVLGAPAPKEHPLLPKAADMETRPLEERELTILEEAEKLPAATATKTTAIRSTTLSRLLLCGA